MTGTGTLLTYQIMLDVTVSRRVWATLYDGQEAADGLPAYIAQIARESRRLREAAVAARPGTPLCDAVKLDRAAVRSTGDTEQDAAWTTMRIALLVTVDHLQWLTRYGRPPQSPLGNSLAPYLAAAIGSRRELETDLCGTVEFVAPLCGVVVATDEVFRALGETR